MFRVFILSVLICIFTSSIYSETDDSIWSNRDSAEGSKKAYEYYKELFGNETNYENAWKFARSAFYYADNYLQLNDMKKKIFSEAKIASEIATNLEPEKVEGHYYLAICVGSLAEVSSIFENLSVADIIIRESTKVINTDPYFDDGGGYMLRGRVYQMAPAIISVGDRQKAIKDYEKALEYGPDNRTLYRFYAELLMDFNRKKAAEIITRGLSIPPALEDVSQDHEEIKILKNLQSKL